MHIFRISSLGTVFQIWPSLNVSAPLPSSSSSGLITLALIHLGTVDPPFSLRDTYSLHSGWSWLSLRIRIGTDHPYQTHPDFHADWRSNSGGCPFARITLTASLIHPASFEGEFTIYSSWWARPTDFIATSSFYALVSCLWSAHSFPSELMFRVPLPLTRVSRHLSEQTNNQYSY